MKTVFKRRANRLAVSGKVDPLRLAWGLTACVGAFDAIAMAAHSLCDINGEFA